VFFQLKTVEEILAIIQKMERLSGEDVILNEAHGRILSNDLIAPEDLPGFSRSSMDGFAVRARDTYGATENMPALLEVAGEVLMGESSAIRVQPGQAVRIATGGMLPPDADAVVMVEYCHDLDDRTIEVSRTVSPLENVIQPDDDVRKGRSVLPAGVRLRPQDLGVLAGLGVTRVPVVRRPRIAILSTGDEVVSVDRSPMPGQVRDINSHTLAAFCRGLGADSIALGLTPDRFEALREQVVNGLALGDSVWISGGSSVGMRDLTVQVLESLERMTVLAHGVSISPGKPTILASNGLQTVWGIPGHAASALVIAEILLAPFLERISGRRRRAGERIGQAEAELARNIESAAGRDDYIRVRLDESDGKWIADPIFGKSGLISPLAEADGLVRIDRFTEGLYRGDRVTVHLFRDGS